MSDRASHLARQFVTRFRSLEGTLRSDPAEDPVENLERRHALAAKILAVELGRTDEATVQTVLSAIPRLYPDKDISENDLKGFSTFLRLYLRLE